MAEANSEARALNYIGAYILAAVLLSLFLWAPHGQLWQQIALAVVAFIFVLTLGRLLL